MLFSAWVAYENDALVVAFITTNRESMHSSSGGSMDRPKVQATPLPLDVLTQSRYCKQSLAQFQDAGGPERYPIWYLRSASTT